MTQPVTLIACWTNELSQLDTLVEGMADVVVFEQRHSSVTKASIPSTCRLVSIDQLQFSQRDEVLKAPSDLALWLYAHAQQYDRVICSRQGGLGFFVARLQAGVACCQHWQFESFAEPLAYKEYQDARHFLDKAGLLRDFIENHQDPAPVETDIQPLSPNGAELSVVIPFHNRAQYLSQTLDSLLEQTISSFKVWLVNDASNQASREALNPLIEEVQRKGLDITIIDSQQPLGAAGARNLGITSVTTPFVLFLDDDDVLQPYALAYCLQAQQLQQCDVVTMAFSYFSGADSPDFANTPGMLIHFHSDQDWVSALTYNCIGGITAMYRTELLRQYGRFECGRYAGEEDWQLLLKLSIAGCRFYNIPLPLLWYRNTPDSLSKKMLHYDSRQQLFSLFKQVLPPQLAHLPEFVTGQQVARRTSGNEFAFGRLGWQLREHAGKPIYVYGAGQLGQQVLEWLTGVGLAVDVAAVIDRNADFIRKLGEYRVTTLAQCEFGKDPVVIIASLSFVDEIVAQLPEDNLSIIRLDAQ